MEEEQDFLSPYSDECKEIVVALREHDEEKLIELAGMHDSTTSRTILKYAATRGLYALVDDLINKGVNSRINKDYILKMIILDALHMDIAERLLLNISKSKRNMVLKKIKKFLYNTDEVSDDEELQRALDFLDELRRKSQNLHQTGGTHKKIKASRKRHTRKRHTRKRHTHKN